MIEEIEQTEESQCDECGRWTNIEDLEEFGDDVEISHLCPVCFYRATSQLDPIEM